MIRKGEKVTFGYDGEERKGIVTKGGSKKIEARIIGTEMIVRGHPIGFWVEDFEIPKDPHSVMDKWKVVKYREFGLGGDGVIYKAFITLDGVNILAVYNNGGGGETDLCPINQGTRETLRQFHNDAKIWVKQFGWDRDPDPFETWFDWDLDHKPFGVLSSDYLKKQKEEWEKMFPPKEKK